jgi:hypothetical protein
LMILVLSAGDCNLTTLVGKFGIGCQTIPSAPVFLDKLADRLKIRGQYKTAKK